MKRAKDRLHRVIVVGATPAGIAAANKLGELGIPVILVDSDYDLDIKLSREDWKLDSGVRLNYANRSGLIQILRNPNIKCVMPAQIKSIKHTQQGFRMVYDRLQTFINPEKCVLCGRCHDACPVTLPSGEKALKLKSRRSLPGRALIEKTRQPLCQEDCPLGVNAMGYVALAKEGRFTEALELVREHNILPGICGRICSHPCENACRRGDLDGPVAIRDIKRFIADFELSKPDRSKKNKADIKKPDRRKEKIAVVGSGPAGLAAAADLARLGYNVTVYEKEKKPGGLLRYGIGPHRLPREILDKELNYIKQLGVKFVTATAIDIEKGTDGLKQLKKDADAVILATGIWSDRMLGIPGENLKRVESCLDFLTRFYRRKTKKLKEKVAVIGDGNAALDLSRVLKRIGANVTILSWFPEDLIPADPEEIKAATEEGIKIKYAAQAVAFKGTKGNFERIVCRSTQPGTPDANGIPWPVIIQDSKPFELKFDRVFVAIGQISPFIHELKSRVSVTEHGYFKVDENFNTNMKNVFAAGDAVHGASSVVEAMASGRKTARAVHASICGEEQASIDLGNKTQRPDRDFSEIPEDLPSKKRATVPEKRPAARKNNFSEVSLGLNATQIISEAGRCLKCGICSECFECLEACGAAGAVNHNESCVESLEQAGVLIIADPTMAPSSIKGEDVIRAYGPKSAKTDVYAMMIRGYASAAIAMILLGKTFQQPKGHGISFSQPDPGLSEEVRVGIFACKCNDSLGWIDDMDRFMEDIKNHNNVVHTEILSSACTPEGSTGIIRSIHQNGITRAVLASCVCCPLNFICSACTDQRSRLKEALFTGTGITRSMVETCNLRGEVLRHVEHHPSVAVERFKGLVSRSVNRAQSLRSFPVPARDYNFTTAVIGDSEAAINSALTLAEAGVEVFWYSPSKEFIDKTLIYPTIHAFNLAAVKGLTGSLGNFHVFVEADNFQQVIQVGAVIMDEKSRKSVQYIHQEGLPGRVVSSEMQKEGTTGIPFFYPGMTAIPGLYLSDLPGIHVSNRQKGAAAAVHAVAAMPHGPVQSKAFFVRVNAEKCRGCGRCARVCPYQAITLRNNSIGGRYAYADEALCKGCGNCIPVCPSNAADSQFRSQKFLENIIEELLEQ